MRVCYQLNELKHRGIRGSIIGHSTKVEDLARSTYTEMLQKEARLPKSRASLCFFLFKLLRSKQFDVNLSMAWWPQPSNLNTFKQHRRNTNNLLPSYSTLSHAHGSVLQQLKASNHFIVYIIYWALTLLVCRGTKAFLLTFIDQKGPEEDFECILIVKAYARYVLNL